MQQFSKLHSYWFWISLSAISLVGFIATHWSQRTDFEGLTIKALILLASLVITTLIWLATARKLSFPILFSNFGLLSIGGYLLFRSFNPGSTSIPSASFVFVLILSCCALAGWFSYAITKAIPRYTAQRPLIICLLLTGLLFISSYKALVRLSLLSPKYEKVQIAQKSAEFNKEDLYSAINTVRVSHKLTMLTPSTGLEKIAARFLEKQGTKTGAQDTSTNDVKKTMEQQKDYDYATIADVYASISTNASEQEIVEKWLQEPAISEILLDGQSSDIGIAQEITPQDPSLRKIYVLAGSPKKPIITPSHTQTPQATPKVYFTGVDLFTAVNASRIRHGVPVLQQRNELCTIASVRLNQQLDKGKIDNHEGFDSVLQRFKDQIEFSHVAENLAAGFDTADETVTAWEGSPGHLVLLKDGAFAYGCTAANRGFSVLIAAY